MLASVINIARVAKYNKGGVGVFLVPYSGFIPSLFSYSYSYSYSNSRLMGIGHIEASSSLSPSSPSPSPSLSEPPLRLGPNLSKYGVNLNKQVMEGKIDPVIGRKKEIERTIQVLSRRTKNNPCLIGEPGIIDLVKVPTEEKHMQVYNKGGYCTHIFNYLSYFDILFIGVGKTAIAEGLAQMICANQVPEWMQSSKKLLAH
jgi:hypothetical protein